MKNNGKRLVHSPLKRKNTLTALIAISALFGCQAQEYEGGENTPSPYSEKDEAVYLERYEVLTKSTQRGGGLTKYDPVEPVKSAQNIVPMPSAALEGKISPAVIEQAISFAAERSSSALIVAKQGEIISETYFGDFDKTSPIVSKSFAKPLTAILIGRAIKLGHITSLDQPAADYLSEWAGDPVKSKITLRQLLGMRSGLLPQGFATSPQDVLTRAYLHPRHDEVIINDYPITHTPGERYEYSNANAEIIAPIIERATGQRYADFVTTALLEPLSAAGGEVWVNREGGTAHSGCCIMLPARTWLKFGQLLLNGGSWEGRALLPEGYLKAMRTPDPVNPYHGLGVWVTGPYVERRGSAHPSIAAGKTLHSAPYLDKDLYLFDGNSKQVVYMIPSLQMVVLRTGNYPPKDREWDNAYLPNLLIGDAIETGQIRPPVPQLKPGSGQK